jgi:hypothetical protein
LEQRQSDKIDAHHSSKNTKSNSQHIDNTTDDDKELEDGRVVGQSRTSSCRPSESESNADDVEQDEEDVQKLLTDINNEAIQELKNEETDTALEALRRGE